MLKDNKDENDKTELVQYQSDENDKKTKTKTHQSQPRSPQWTRSQQTDYFRLKDDLGEVEIFLIINIARIANAVQVTL